MNSPLLLLATKLDSNIIHFFQISINDFGIELAIFVSSIGSPQSFLLLTIAATMLFWLYKKPYYLLQFISTLAIGGLTVYIMKRLIARPRPVEALLDISGYSFPSGHATIATLFCCLIIFAYKDHINSSFLRLLFIVSFLFCALAISFSRVYLSVHYLSDVVVGMLLGLLVASISVFVFENFFKKEELK